MLPVVLGIKLTGKQKSLIVADGQVAKEIGFHIGVNRVPSTIVGLIETLSL